MLNFDFFLKIVIKFCLKKFYWKSKKTIKTTFCIFFCALQDGLIKN